MRAVTINMPEPLDAQIEQLANENGLTLSDFLVEVSKDLIRQDGARKRFSERAERGKDKVENVLTMLQRD
jgi:hypothetical protein